MPHHKTLNVTDSVIDALKAIPMKFNMFPCADALGILVDMNGGDSTKILDPNFLEKIAKTDVSKFAEMIRAMPLFQLVELGQEKDGDVWISNNGECNICKRDKMFYLHRHKSLIILDIADFEGKGERYFMDWDLLI